MFVRVLLGCVLLCALAFASSAEEPKEAKETKLKPTLVSRGSHSAIRKEKFVLITGEGGWKSLWKEHRGDKETQRFTETEQEVEIDFDTHYVVALFVNGEGVMVTPRQRGETILIGYHGWISQTEGGARDRRTDFEKAKNDAVAPYAFVVLPKPVKTVVIEQDLEWRRDEPHIWKERMRFPAPKDDKK